MNRSFVKKICMAGILMVLPLLCFLWSEPFADAASSPWQWKLTLKDTSDKGPGAMKQPTALFIDAERERYYVVDSGNNRLLSFDRAGVFISAFSAVGALEVPFDMVRDQRKDLWVVEKGRNTLTRLDMQGQTTIPRPLQAHGRTVYPDRLEYGNELVYVLDKASGGVFAYDPDFKLVASYICPPAEGGFIDFMVDGKGIIALGARSKTLYRLAADGSVVEKTVLGEEIPFPVSFALGPDGLYYVLDRHRSDVAVFDKSGALRYRFLGPGQAVGQLYFPGEIRFDPWGQLCIVEEGNGRVQVFSRN